MKRYEKVGGLAFIAEEFERSDIKLKKIANSVGVSDMTVRNDIVALIGKQRYDEAVERRKKYLKGPASKLASGELNGEEALALISDSPELFYSPELFRRVVQRILAVADENGEKMERIFATRARLKSFSMAGRNVAVRIVAPIPGTSHGDMGYVRVKAGKVPPGCEFMLVICDANPLVSYVIPAKTFRAVKTLALRYTNFFEGGLYASYREGWKLIFEEV